MRAQAAPRTLGDPVFAGGGFRLTLCSSRQSLLGTMCVLPKSLLLLCVLLPRHGQSAHLVPPGALQFRTCEWAEFKFVKRGRNQGSFVWVSN